MIDVTGIPHCPACGSSTDIREVEEIIEHSVSEDQKILAAPAWAKRDPRLLKSVAAWWHCGRCHMCFTLGGKFELCHDLNFWEYLIKREKRGKSA